jgi:antitoxin component HigA of HigAB toxin-antitoxin module
MRMMTTLEAQKQRLLEELIEAKEQMALIKAQPCPDFKILNYYMDVVSRDTQLVEMIDSHLFGDQQSRIRPWVS